MNLLENVIQQRSSVLVFLANSDEARDFLIGDALDELSTDYDLHYVIPHARAAELYALAPDVFTDASTFELDVPDIRQAVWLALEQQVRRTPPVVVTAKTSILRAATYLSRKGMGAVKRLARIALPQSVRHRLRNALVAAPANQRGFKQPLPIDIFKHAEPKVTRALREMSQLPGLARILNRTKPLFVIVLTSCREVFCNDVLWVCTTEHIASLLVQNDTGGFSCRPIFHKPTFVVLIEDGKAEFQKLTQAHQLKRIPAADSSAFGHEILHFCRTTVEPLARRYRSARATKTRRTISHAYGANLIAQDYCGTNLRDPTVPGYWMHGWIPAFHNVDPAFIALHKKTGQHSTYDYEAQIRDEKEITPQWVSRQDQADYLIQSGYRHVKAIGLPICYLPEERIQRIPRSLLVMPPHSLGTRGPEDPLAEELAELIAATRGDFDHIWACLHQDDLAKKQWVEAFRRRGIDVFCGADQGDPFTLLRLRRILSSFECVTTNGFGSQIAYAAYCGARVCIYGPFAETSRQRMTDAHSVRMFPQLGNIAYELCRENTLRRHFPFLFVEPSKATACREWGAAQVGEPHRLPPAELAALFGWT